MEGTQQYSSAPLPPPQPAGPPVAQPVAPVPKGGSAQAVMILAACFLIIGGTVFAAYMGWVSIPYLFEPPSLEEIAANMQDIRSARIGVDLGISIGERDPAVNPISIFDLLGKEPGDSEAEEDMESLSTTMTFLPEEFGITLTGTSDWDRSADRIQGESKFGGALDMSGLSAEFEVELRTIGKDLYVRINKIPPLIPFIGGVQGKWIKTGSDATDGGEVGVFKYKSDIKEEEGDGEDGREMDLMGEVTVLMTEMISSGALSTETKPERSEDPLGRPAMRYVLALDRDKAIAAIRSAVDRREELLPNVKDFVILTDEESSKAAFMYEGSFYDVISKNLEQVLFADRKTGMPLALTTDIVIAFDEHELPDAADRQIGISLALTFDRVNEPISVEAPEEFVTQDEVSTLTSGYSEDEKKMRDQVGNIEDLRDALETYEKMNGSYPDRLDMLVGTEVKPDYISDPESADKFTKVVVAVPDDLFTGEPLDYRVDEDGEYMIRYMLEIPEISSNIGRYDYAEGINTATPDTMTLEGSVHAFGSDSASMFVGDEDSTRVADVKQIGTGLELYYADYNEYPEGRGIVLGQGNAKSLCEGGWKEDCGDSLIFMWTVPAAPTPPGSGCSEAENGYVYTRDADGKDYALTFCTGRDVGSIKAGIHEMYSGVIDYRTTDSDSDGLYDALERELGTNPYDADTDGDGYSDGAEVSGGYDPLTNSKTGVRVGD